jgi:predicted nucleic acid-binding protein
VISGQPRLRLFLDSNVLTGGMVSRWGLDKAVLSLCAARVCRLVLAEAVRGEVESNLLLHASGLGQAESNLLLEDFDELIRLTAPQMVAYPDKQTVLASRHLIAHAADVPVLLSAVEARPDWLITHNTKHFTPKVAQATGLRIATPIEFFRNLAAGIREISAP